MKNYLASFMAKSIIVFVFSLFLFSCDSFNPGKPEPSKNLEIGIVTEVASKTISSSGGTVIVDAPGNEIDGMEIVIPKGSYSNAKTFTVSTAPITSHNLGKNFNPITPFIQIENGGGYSDSIMEVTIPISITEGEIAIGFYYDEITGKLEGIPVKEETRNSITLLTRHFMSVSELSTDEDNSKGVDIDATANLIICTILESQLKAASIITSGFKVGIDDWEFTNYGSYLSAGGHCNGQCLASMWYYYEKKLKGDDQLFGKFSTVPTIDEDNAIGYRLCSVIQEDFTVNGKVSKFFWKYIDFDQTKDKLKYLSCAAAMLVTGEPQGISIWKIKGQDNNGFNILGGHALICYQIDFNKGLLYISDPNHPGVGQSISFKDDYFENYMGKANGFDDPDSYPYITWYAKTALIEWTQIGKRYSELLDSTIGNIAPNTFPPYTIWVKGKVDQELKNGYTTTNDTLRCIVECPTTSRAFIIDGRYFINHTMCDGEGNIISKKENGGLEYTILEPGLNKIGFYISSEKKGVLDKNGKNFPLYIDFKWITVMNSPLSIIADPEQGQIGDQVTFTANTKGTAPKSAKYVWNFGDGSSKETKTDNTINHIFEKNGKYNVKVELLDASNKKINETEITYEIKEKATSMDFSFGFTVKNVNDYGTVQECDYQISGKAEVFGTEKIISITQDNNTKAITVLLKEGGACNVTFSSSFSNYTNTSFDKWFYPGAGYKFKITLKRLIGMSCGSLPLDNKGNGSFIIDYGSRYFTFNGKYHAYEEWWYNDKLDETQTREYDASAPGFDFIIKSND